MNTHPTPEEIAKEIILSFRYYYYTIGNLNLDVVFDQWATTPQGRELIGKIGGQQANKPKYSPLPAPTPPPATQVGMKWVKASERLPLEKAFWNVEDGFKKDCKFPVRIGKIYGMGEIFDQRLLSEPNPKYSICINGIHHFENEFSEIEWLDEQSPEVSPTQTGEECDLNKLYEWIMDEERKPAQTYFTSSVVRNIAKEIEYRINAKSI